MKQQKKQDQTIQSLKVKEIYPAILGESAWAGYPCLIIRLAGCNLRCSYCDTEYAYTGGRHMSVGAVVESAKKHGQNKILVTGGEPLLQKAASVLLSELIKAGHEPILETNGSRDLKLVPQGVHIAMDIKTPGSGHHQDNLMENLVHLKPDDDLKLVLVNREDYLWTRRMIEKHRLESRFRVILSPAHASLPPARLAGWIVKDRLQARLGLQIHKYIFGEKARKV